MSQVHKELKILEVVMPKTKIPVWWKVRGLGRNIIFWARRKFPIVALAFAFYKVDYQAVRLRLFIEGEHVHVQRQQFHNFTIAEDHVLLCDLRVLFSDEKWKRLDVRVGHDNGWKRVEVRCETDIIPIHWGVYVYKFEADMFDIQFTCPYTPESRVARSSHVKDYARFQRAKITLYARPRVRLQKLKPQIELPVDWMLKKRPRSSRLHVIPSFSKTLQTVVENLERLTAPRQHKGSSSKLEDGDDADYYLDRFAETIMSSDVDVEDEEEGESDTEA